MSNGTSEIVPPERRGYVNPPIEEAVCQVTFAFPIQWNVAIPGLVYERLRPDYPADPEAQRPVQAALQPGDAGASFSLTGGPERYVYKDSSGVRLVVMGQDNLSVNCLRPYEGWPGLKARLERVLSLVSEVVTLPPVRRVENRYINRIVLPSGPLNTDDYFTTPVRTAENGGASFRRFVNQVESLLSDGATSVVSTFASLEPTPEGLPFLLDLNVIREGLSLTTTDEILNAAEALKNIENLEFESWITDATRGLFV